MDKLLAKLSEQQDALFKQREQLKSSDEQVSYSRAADYVSATTNSEFKTSALESFSTSTTPISDTFSTPQAEIVASPSAEEVLRLKLELEAAKGKLARMDQELAQSRITRHTLDQVIGTPSELNFPVSQHGEAGDIHLNNLQQGRKTNTRSQADRDISWATGDDSRSDTSDALSASGFNRARAIWGNDPNASFQSVPPPAAAFQSSEVLSLKDWMNRGFGQPFVDSSTQYGGAPANSYRGDRMMPDQDLLAPATVRRNNAGDRFNNRAAGSLSYAGSSGSYDGYTAAPSYGISNGVRASIGVGMSGLPAGMYPSYQPQPIGTPLSPHAPEFTSSTGWKGDVSIAKYQ